MKRFDWVYETLALSVDRKPSALRLLQAKTGGAVLSPKILEKFYID